MITAADARQLRRDLEAAGAMRAPTSRSWSKFLLNLGLGLCCVAAMTVAPAALSVLVLIPAAGLFLGVAILMGHEASHGAACRSRWQNDLMVLLAFGCLAGVSTQFWAWKHNGLHHSYPNMPGKDRDLHLGPIALSADQHARSSRFVRWLQRNVQAIALWPAGLLLASVMRMRSLTFVIGRARTHGIDRRWLIDVGAMTAHYVFWLVLPSLFFPLWAVVGTYLAVFGVVGAMMAFIFNLAHTGKPLVSEFADPWSLQIETVRNVRVGPLFRWIWCGLDCQLEHHLCPGLSHLNLRRASPVIRAWVQEHGHDVAEASTWECVKLVTEHLRSSWKDAPIVLQAPGSPGDAA